MLIAIISDSHDNITNLARVLLWLKDQKVALIIHCGDIVHLDVLDSCWPKDFSVPFHCVHGNGDFPSEFKKIPPTLKKNLVYHGEKGNLEIDGYHFAFCHRPELAKKIASVAESGSSSSSSVQMIFYGHTHRPWIEKINSVFLVNPGNLSDRRYAASFALYDSQTKRLDLKLLSTI